MKNTQVKITLMLLHFFMYPSLWSQTPPVEVNECVECEARHNECNASFKPNPTYDPHILTLEPIPLATNILNRIDEDWACACAMNPIKIRYNSDEPLEIISIDFGSETLDGTEFTHSSTAFEITIYKTLVGSDHVIKIHYDNDVDPIIIDEYLIAQGGGLCIVSDIKVVEEPVIYTGEAISFPTNQGKLGDPGHGILIAHTTNVYKNLNLESEFTAGWSPFSYPLPSALNPTDAAIIQSTISKQNWRIFTMSAGPSIELGKQKLRTNFFAKAGLMVVQNPTEQISYSPTGIPFNTDNAIFRTSGTDGGFIADAGIRFNYKIANRWRIFAESQYTYGLSKFLRHEERDLAAAIGQNGSISPQLLAALPFSEKRTRYQALSLQLGIAFELPTCEK